MPPTVKFSIIAIFFVITLASRFFCYSKREHTFLAVGMAFTLLADYFLVLLGNLTAGVFVFCFVHVAYILRVRPLCKGFLCVLAFAVFLFLAALAIYIIFRPEPLLIIGAFYAALFVCNFAINIKYRHFLPKANRILVLSGLALFALCDINVLLFNLPRFAPGFPTEISRWAFDWIWVFYLPGQFLLCVSSIRYARRDVA